MLVLLAAHLVAALFAPALVRWLGRRACYLLAVVPAAGLGWALTHTAAMRDRRAVTEVYPWVGQLDLDLAFRMTSLSWLMVLLVGGVGALALVYCARYFAAGEPGLGRFAGVFVGFAGAMLGLIVSDNLIVLYVFWELTTVLSYLLIGHDPASRAGRRAAMQALIVTTLGGLAMLVGIIMLGEHAGSYRWSQVAVALPDGGYLAVAVVLLLLGALSKSAIFPFSFWLPAAMAAPTPVSAYLHAAAMVKAGVFLVGLLGPALAGAGRRRAVAPDRAGRRHHDHAVRRLVGTAPARPEAAAGLRHGQSARPAGRGPGRRPAGRGAGRRDDAAGARAVQGGAVLRGGHHRPLGGHPRPPRPQRSTAVGAGGLVGHRARRGLDGRGAAAGRVRRQGGDLRGLPRWWLVAVAGPGGRGLRVGADGGPI